LCVVENFDKKAQTKRNKKEIVHASEISHSATNTSMENDAIMMDIKTHFGENHARINQLRGELAKACKELKNLSAKLKKEKNNLKKSQQKIRKI